MSLKKIFLEGISNKKEQKLKELFYIYLIKMNSAFVEKYADHKEVKKYKEGSHAWNKHLIDMYIREGLVTAFFDIIMRIDPTDVKKYSTWLIRMTMGKLSHKMKTISTSLKMVDDNKHFIIQNISTIIRKLREDTNKYRRNLEVFTILKDRNIAVGNEADINRYKSFEALYKFVKPYLSDPDFFGTKKGVIMGESDIIFDDGTWKIVVPESYRASCFWGTGTNWCTAVNDSDSTTFDSYTSGKDKLYIILGKNRKFQFGGIRESLLFTNEEDEQAIDEFYNLVGDDKFIQIIQKIVVDDQYEYIISESPFEYFNMVDTLIDPDEGLRELEFNSAPEEIIDISNWVTPKFKELLIDDLNEYLKKIGKSFSDVFSDEYDFEEELQQILYLITNNLSLNSINNEFKKSGAELDKMIKMIQKTFK